VTIDDSEFVGMGDDAVNIHGRYGLVTERVDDRTLAVANGRMHFYYDKERTPWEQPRQGDTLEFGSPQQPLHAMGRLTVASATLDPARRRTMVTLTQPLPKEVVPNCVLANVSATPAVSASADTIAAGLRSAGLRRMERDIRDLLIDGMNGSGCSISARSESARTLSTLVNVHSSGFRFDLPSDAQEQPDRMVERLLGATDGVGLSRWCGGGGPLMRRPRRGRSW
jgi:hypothetical protein